MLIARTVDSCPQHQDLVLVCYLVANVPRSLVTVSAARGCYRRTHSLASAMASALGFFVSEQILYTLPKASHSFPPITR
jgi:hypothetical protein